MSRSSNQKRKRKTRLATGVPCERPWAEDPSPQVGYLMRLFEHLSMLRPEQPYENIEVH